MKANILFIPLILLCSSCTGKSGPDKQSDKNDSTKVADSAASPSSVPMVKILTYEQREGKFLYTKYCLVCHGTEGKGDGFNAFNLDPKPKDFTEKQYMHSLTDEKLIATVSQGGGSVNKSPIMSSWGGRLTKLEIEYLVAYLRTFTD